MTITKKQTVSSLPKLKKMVAKDYPEYKIIKKKEQSADTTKTHR